MDPGIVGLGSEVWAAQDGDPEWWCCLSLGFTEIMPWQSVPLEESLPTCQRGDTFTVGEVKMLEKQTSPPDYLTEAELITLMEKHGIGGCICPVTRPKVPSLGLGPKGYTSKAAQ